MCRRISGEFQVDKRIVISAVWNLRLLLQHWFSFSWFRNRNTVPSPLSICHLAELDNDTLYLYGPGSLDALDRNWGNQAVQAVSAISFKFIDFDNIVPQLYKIRARFPSLLVSIPRKKHD